MTDTNAELKTPTEIARQCDNSPGEDLKQDKPKIAVITVHGVADQSAHDSARAIASLLLNHNKSEKQVHNQSEKQVQYTPFYESTLRVAVRPVRLAEEPPKLDPSPKQERHEREPDIHNHPQNPGSEPSMEDILDENAHEYMRTQLRNYEGEGVGSTYETVRLEGSRLGPDNQPQVKVHVHEMYWADLSRLGTGFFRILGEFYQLLFHLSSLGVHAVNSAKSEYENSWWNWYGRTQTWAGQVLSMFIPIANLYLLLTAPITLPGNISAQFLPLIARISLAIIGTALTGYWLFWPRSKTPFWLWVIPPTLLGGGLLGLGYSFLQGSVTPWLPLGDYQILAFEWCALSAIIMWLLMSQYGRQRPGAGKVSAFMGVFLAGIITKLLLSAEDSHQGITDAAFKTVEVIYIGLVFCWAAFFILQIAAALLGCVAVWQSTAKPSNSKTNDGCYERAKRAAWTARLTLAIPSSLFIAVTLTLLGALDRVGSRLLPEESFYTPSFLLTNQSPNSFTGPNFVHQLIISAASPAFIVVLICLLLTVIMAVWSLLPGAWAEVRSPKDDALSQRFGEWLTKGFYLMDIWGNCFVVLMAIVFPIAYVYCIIDPETAAKFDLTEEILGVFATVLVASATSLLAFRGRLDRLSLGFRNVLDILLDVDNYLRQHPEDNNPRARICARYVSLLRYVCRWQDPEDGRGYDAILIVAHSQGTAITADLLRFLKREPDSALEPETDSALDRLVEGNLPIYFFTMGSPLRQLYGWGFPHLYNWARHYDETCWTRKPHNPEHIYNDQKPDPTKLLGVTRWVNTFRSGDYVGRFLWRGDVCDYQWLKPAERDDKHTTWSSDRNRPVHVSEDEKHTRREFCLGAGAHTHYWDGTSAEVAAEIDILIREACWEKLQQRI
jgi:hypothetical protein